MPPRSGMSSLEIRTVVQRLADARGAHFDKAYEITRGVLLLRLRQPGAGKREVALGAGSFLVEPPQTPETPESPSTFAMTLRKRLSGTRLAAVDQHGFDRVVTFRFERQGQPAGDLIAEIFGDGNLVLADPTGKILAVHRYEEWATRTLKPGAPYEYPPPRLDPTATGPGDLLPIVQKGKKKLVQALAVEAGLGGELAEHLLTHTGIDGTQKAAEATQDDLRKVLWELQKLLDEVDPQQGWLRRDDQGRIAEVSLLPPKDPAGWEQGDFSAAITQLYTGPTVERAVRETEDRFAEELRKLETQRHMQTEAVGRMEEESRTASTLGEAVYLHYAPLEKLLDGLKKERAQKEWAEIRKAYEGREMDTPNGPIRLERLDEHTGTATVLATPRPGASDRIAIPLDVRLSVPDNAEKLYAESKKQRDKAQGARQALERTTQRLEALQQRREAAVADIREKKTRPKPATRHFWFEAYRWSYTTDGHLVVAGRDASSNDKIVKKYLDTGDRYVHADMHGAPSCVVKRNPQNESIPEPALLEAGQLAVAYSRAFGQFASADAYWVTPEQVSKSPQAGEYLPKGAFMVRGERNWMRGLPARAAAGVVRLGKDGRPDPDGLHLKVMGGAPESVQHHAQRWIVVEAENTKRSQAVAQAAQWLDCSEEEASQALPPSGFRIVDQGGPPPEASA